MKMLKYFFVMLFCFQTLPAMAEDTTSEPKTPTLKVYTVKLHVISSVQPKDSKNIPVNMAGVVESYKTKSGTKDLFYVTSLEFNLSNKGESQISTTTMDTSTLLGLSTNDVGSLGPTLMRLKVETGSTNMPDQVFFEKFQFGWEMPIPSGQTVSADNAITFNISREDIGFLTTFIQIPLNKPYLLAAFPLGSLSNLFILVVEVTQ